MSVLLGKIRGNGRDLSRYLLRKGKNEWVRLLNVDSMERPDGNDLKNLLGAFSQNELLTKSRQGIYHLTINPETSVAARMSDEDWEEASEIAIAALGFTGQRKASVLHCKNGRIHVHVAIERYDHERGKMIPIPHNYRKHDLARAKLEQRFAEQLTPQRNAKRPAMRETLTKLWNERKSALTFLRAAKEQGLVITTGYGRIPYMVVDETGRSFNLRRHIDGVKIRDLRDGFPNTILISEKEAIAFIRNRQQLTKVHGQIPIETKPKAAFGETAKDAVTVRQTEGVIQETDTTQDAFAENLAAMKERQQTQKHRPRMR